MYKIWLLAFLSFTFPLLSCTDFQIKAHDETVINARSMEFAIPLKSAFLVFPRGIQHSAKTPNGEKGLSWTSKYGYVAADALDLHIPVDGINEKGLSFGYLWFRGAQYQTIHADETKKALSLSDLGPWLLGNFANIEEVKRALKDVKIWGEFIQEIQRVPPLHVSLHDSTGANLVIEFIDGELKVYDNPLGVLTNFPSFDWQLTNLRNYLSLTTENTSSVTLDGIVLHPIGQGSGLIGLPGDWTPPSRFVRIVTLNRFADTPKNAMDAINLAEHLLNTVDVPHGIVRTKETLDEFTQWICIKDLTHQILYFRSYEDLGLKSIDLKKVNFNKGEPIKIFPIGNSYNITDITDQMVVSKPK